ncbi:hypothetical protein DCC81_15525 [Chitinophaga parva]|uniref:Uncharacterized protein n=1 Tax=Chitinophaga parva TaxID=2169414 RepID=A0A2T7BHC7_9BACT|nr:hypothetical protein [Chitinophaga parva]PUZ25678.1 hypothetical protein DCC81_15525 [Chitinophaga parva]
MVITSHDIAYRLPLSGILAVIAIIFLIVELFFYKIKKSIILETKKSLDVLEICQDNINQNLIPNLEAGTYLSQIVAVSSSYILAYCSYRFSWFPIAGKINRQLRHEAPPCIYQQSAVAVAALRCNGRIMSLYKRNLL